MTHVWVVAWRGVTWRQSQRGWERVCVVGAVGVWFDSQRRFLTASHWFKKDSLGGAVRWCVAGARWRPAVDAGHDRARVRVTAHALGWAAGGRVWWAPKIKSRASGGRSA